ncbi:MAG: AMP-binding protein [Sporichthyaceae bacterium]
MKELVFHRSLLPALARRPDRVGFVDAGTGATTTNGEHLSRVSRLCAALADELGITPEKRFAVLALNSVSYLELWHAAMFGAGVINPLNLRFSAEELVYVLTDSESEVCFVDSTFAPMVEAIRARTPLKKVVLIGSGEGACDIRYSDLLKNSAERLPAEPDEESPCVLMYTGGTTGHPKGVVTTQRAQILNQYHLAMALPWHHDGTFLLQTPMFHAATMPGIVGATMFGNTCIVLPMFTPDASLAATETYRPTMTLLVPTMIGMVVNLPDFRPDRLASLRRLVYGASPMPEPLLKKLLELFPDLDVVHGYGMTEGCTVLTILPASEPRAGRRLGSCGLPLPGVELSIQDEDGNVVPSGEPGEVCARAGNFLTEYFKKPEATAEALKDGWYHTGDVGYLDSEGFLFLVDRAKDMIISGGENVYGTEVENAIASHAAILQVAVIGVPHETWGEAVHAICVLKPGHEATAEEIIAHARGSIAGYKVPRTVDFRAEPLPLSAAMKVLKRELRAPFWEGRERGIN